VDELLHRLEAELGGQGELLDLDLGLEALVADRLGERLEVLALLPLATRTCAASARPPRARALAGRSDFSRLPKATSPSRRYADVGM